jgi:hypothetical protein
VPDDDRKEFPEGREPLQEQKVEPQVVLSDLELAQQAREARVNGKAEGGTPPGETTTHPRGGEHMAGENGTLQLSEEAQRLINEARAEAKAARDENADLRKKFNSMFSENTVSKADAFVAHLKGIGLDEEHGFSGALVVIRDLMSEDDGGPAVQSDKFADDGNADGTLTLSDAIRRVFKAIELSEDGKVKLGQKITQPATTTTTEKTGEVELGEDGKPVPDAPEGQGVRGAVRGRAGAQLARDNPALAKALGMAIPSANGSKGGE